MLVARCVTEMDTSFRDVVSTHKRLRGERSFERVERGCFAKKSFERGRFERGCFEIYLFRFEKEI